MLSVSEATLSRWRGAKTGPPVVNLAPGLYRYRVDDLEAWIEGSRG
ncbi:helix-turn-helix domain-containing protein [Microbacterium sp. VKM Ac-2923]|nr:helix-turn-helix domain-containing protein [Microbacterium sp. VKM Ac-2923]